MDKNRFIYALGRAESLIAQTCELKLRFGMMLVGWTRSKRRFAGRKLPWSVSRHQILPMPTELQHQHFYTILSPLSLDCPAPLFLDIGLLLQDPSRLLLTAYIRPKIFCSTGTVPSTFFFNSDSFGGLPAELRFFLERRQ